MASNRININEVITLFFVSYSVNKLNSGSQTGFKQRSRFCSPFPSSKMRSCWIINFLLASTSNKLDVIPSHLLANCSHRQAVLASRQRGGFSGHCNQECMRTINYESFLGLIWVRLSSHNYKTTRPQIKCFPKDITMLNRELNREPVILWS